MTLIHYSAPVAKMAQALDAVRAAAAAHPARSGVPWHDALDTAVVQALAAGASDATIADAAGVGRATVRALRADRGYTSHGRGRPVGVELVGVRVQVAGAWRYPGGLPGHAAPLPLVDAVKLAKRWAARPDVEAVEVVEAAPLPVAPLRRAPTAEERAAERQEAALMQARLAAAGVAA